ncbi:MAG: hypothetical protein ACREQN_00120 [Candidatus Binataceae bacterium]
MVKQISTFHRKLMTRSLVMVRRFRGFGAVFSGAHVKNSWRRNLPPHQYRLAAHRSYRPCSMFLDNLGNTAGLPEGSVVYGARGEGRISPGELKLDDQWNAEEANRLLQAALAEIDALADKLSPARAEALLDEFERDVARAFLGRDLPAVRANCEEYERRFRRLAEEEE